ncbi:hypothetical protein NDU88_008825 [Pleurodeles waltl]|uniref:Uncharacterized protein n=1 Tax=Pleurodeles waltl TaxID=8319 RepID=A0AAV7QT29_PLEWA|nr:hypothetical protein NDU88_008825 [Pleurodeles waltl]
MVRCFCDAELVCTLRPFLDILGFATLPWICCYKASGTKQPEDENDAVEDSCDAEDEHDMEDDENLKMILALTGILEDITFALLAELSLRLP